MAWRKESKALDSEGVRRTSVIAVLDIFEDERDDVGEIRGRGVGVAERVRFGLVTDCKRNRSAK